MEDRNMWRLLRFLPNWIRFLMKLSTCIHTHRNRIKLHPPKGLVIALCYGNLCKKKKKTKNKLYIFQIEFIIRTVRSVKIFDVKASVIY